MLVQVYQFLPKMKNNNMDMNIRKDFVSHQIQIHDDRLYDDIGKNEYDKLMIREMVKLRKYFYEGREIYHDKNNEWFPDLGHLSMLLHPFFIMIVKDF